MRFTRRPGAILEKQPNSSGLLFLLCGCAAWRWRFTKAHQETMKWLHWTFKAAPGVASTGVHLIFY